MRAKINLTLLILVVILTSIYTSSKAGTCYADIQTQNCRLQDSLVLVDFYNNTFGDNWTVKWDLTRPMDTWFGISLNANGCVECIDLDGIEGCSISVSFGNNVTGSIPSRLGDLKNLKLICLGNNRITGSLPSSLFELPILESLDFFGNEMIGPLPANMGNASNLEIISLSGNNFIGPLPSSVGELKELEELFVSSNGLIGPLPRSLGEATSLRRLRLHNNRIDGTIPVEIGNLSELINLNLSQNLLTGNIPAEFGQLTKLEDLLLADNILSSEIPPELGNCTALTRLRICHNTLDGELPTTMENWVNLEQFHAHDNKLEGCIPHEIGECIQLTDLRLDQNNLNCEIPIEFGFLINLRLANLSFNELIGPLPRSVGNLNKIQELDISNNDLSGPLPAEFSGMPSLRLFKGQNNGLTGPLPAAIDQLERVIEIDLGNNAIDGTIPPSYGEVPRLRILNLKNNSLSGCYPETLRDDCDKEYDFSLNTELPWEGELDKFCIGGEQTGARCSSDPSIPNETIQEDCQCKAFSCTPVSIVQDAFLCVNESININGQEVSEAGQVIDSLQTAFGCDSVIVYNIAKMELDIITENAQCQGESSGSAIISTNFSGNFDYTLTNEQGEIVVAEVDQSTLPELTKILAPGKYNLAIMEKDLDCMVDTTFTIESRFAAAETTFIEGIQCDDQQYLINGTAYNQDNPSGTELLQTINGCDSAIIVDLIYLSLNTDKTSAKCEDDTNGEITGALSDTTIDFECTVKNEDGLVVFNTITTGEFRTGQMLEPGNYSVELLSTQSGCSYTEEIRIDALHRSPEPVILTDKICQREELIVNGTVYDINNTEGTETFVASTGCDSTVHIALDFYSEVLAQDDSVKLDDYSTSISVLENDEFDAEADISIKVVNMERVVSAEVDGDNIDIEIEENYSGISFIEYELCNTSCNELCSRARVVIVGSIEEYNRGVITPNGDGYNDVLTIPGYDAYDLIEGASINIVNRWGQVIYTAEDYKNDWAGDLQGNSGKPVPEGVYYYHLILKDGSSRLGSTSLIR